MEKPVMRGGFVAVLVAAAVALAGCEEETAKGRATAPSDEVKGELNVAGSSTIAAAIIPIAQKFEAENAGTKVHVDPGLSTYAISQVREGLVQVALSTRPLREHEKKGLSTEKIGRDGLAIIVHKDNPVERLTEEQIVGIFSGKITRWDEIGGKPSEITVHQPARGRTSETLLLERFKLTRDALKSGAPTHGLDQQAVDLIKSNPNGITYGSLGSTYTAKAEGAPIKLLPLGGNAEPTPENVEEKKVEITYDLMLVTREEAPALATAFVDFTKSAEGQKIVEEKGLVAAAEE